MFTSLIDSNHFQEQKVINNIALFLYVCGNVLTTKYTFIGGLKLTTILVLLIMRKQKKTSKTFCFYEKAIDSGMLVAYIYYVVNL